MTSKKVLRAQRVAMENNLPLVYLVDIAGVFLPLQDEVFPDKDDFGKVFDYAARITASGTPQIAAVMGLCVAGGAYLPVICDHLLMTEGSGMYLAAAALAKAAKTTAREFTNEEIVKHALEQIIAQQDLTDRFLTQFPLETILAIKKRLMAEQAA
jgi:acetyl-CoA carboxylase carboxyltransferase component